MPAINTRYLPFSFGILLLLSCLTSITFVSAGPIPFLPAPSLAVRAFPARYECHSETSFYSDDAGHFQECAPGTVCRKVASGSPCVWPDAGGDAASVGTPTQIEGTMTTQQPGASQSEAPAAGESAAPSLEDAFPLPSDDGTQQTTAPTSVITTATDSVAPGATSSPGETIPSGSPVPGDSSTPGDDETDEYDDDDEECEEDDEIGDDPNSAPPAGQDTEQIPMPSDSSPGAGETTTTPPIDDDDGEGEEEECEEDLAEDGTESPPAPPTDPNPEKECEEAEMGETPGSETTHNGTGDDHEPAPNLSDPFPLPTEETSVAPRPSAVPNA